jgi:L-ascorbate oxidase
MRSIVRISRLSAVPLSLVAALSTGLLGCGGDEPVAEALPAFTAPAEVAPDADGVVQLRFGPSAVEIDGKRYCLRAYNGALPGPTIRVPAGQDRRVRVNLHNDFTRSDFREIAGLGGHGRKSCHDFNLTNLHAHGAHVRPDYAAVDPGDPCSGDGCAPGARYFADNVLHHVEVGESAQYRWDLDEDGIHHAGTHWYHPHIHGSTAIQVINGSAGALIVEGELDEIPGIANAVERILVMNHIPIDSESTVPLKEGESCTEETLSAQDFLVVDEKMPTLINGKRKPRMVTPPGQVERWRMVHAGNPDEMGIKLHVGLDESCGKWNPAALVDLTQIARDGLTLPRFYRSDTVWMSPGYRADVMVKMPDEKQTLCLVARRIINDPLGSVIAVVSVDPGAGAPTETNLPDEVAVTADAPPTTWTATVDGQTTEVSCESIRTIHQKIVLLVPTPGETETPLNEDPVVGSCDPSAHGHGIDPDADVCVCPDPNISCRRFDDRRAWGYRSDRAVTVDTSEKWQINAFDGHPFHIHVNPFLVCPNDSNKEPNFAHFRDTFWVQAEDGPREILTHFKSFTGQFVLHCHKLNHEDEGMMELVEICPEGDQECLCLGTDANGQCIRQGDCLAEDKQCQFARAATEAYPLPPAPNPALCGAGEGPPRP